MSQNPLTWKNVATNVDPDSGVRAAYAFGEALKGFGKTVKDEVGAYGTREALAGLPVGIESAGPADILKAYGQAGQVAARYGADPATFDKLAADKVTSRLGISRDARETQAAADLVAHNAGLLAVQQGQLENAKTQTAHAKARNDILDAGTVADNREREAWNGPLGNSFRTDLAKLVEEAAKNTLTPGPESLNRDLDLLNKFYALAHNPEYGAIGSRVQKELTANPVFKSLAENMQHAKETHTALSIAEQKALKAALEARNGAPETSVNTSNVENYARGIFNAFDMKTGDAAKASAPYRQAATNLVNAFKGGRAYMGDPQEFVSLMSRLEKGDETALAATQELIQRVAHLNTTPGLKNYNAGTETKPLIPKEAGTAAGKGIGAATNPAYDPKGVSPHTGIEYSLPDDARSRREFWQRIGAGLKDAAVSPLKAGANHAILFNNAFRYIAGLDPEQDPTLYAGGVYSDAVRAQQAKDLQDRLKRANGGKSTIPVEALTAPVPAAAPASAPQLGAPFKPSVGSTAPLGFAQELQNSQRPASAPPAQATSAPTAAPAAQKVSFNPTDAQKAQLLWLAKAVQGDWSSDDVPPGAAVTKALYAHKSPTMSVQDKQALLQTHGRFLDTPNMTISSGLGPRHVGQGVTNATKNHGGVDVPVAVGTRIMAPADGVVEAVYTGWTPEIGKSRKASGKADGGNFVKVRYPDGSVMTFAHIDRLAGDLKVGTPVRRGQVLALSGNTGASTGPHVHVGYKDAKGNNFSDIADRLMAMQTGDPNTAYTWDPHKRKLVAKRDTAVYA